VKELTSVHIMQSYPKNKTCAFFMAHGVGVIVEFVTAYMLVLVKLAKNCLCINMKIKC